jgi:hypothetical protein
MIFKFFLFLQQKKFVQIFMLFKELNLIVLHKTY